MALARSASGPGGLSINTSSANSLFGSGTTPATGGMFGNTQASKPASGLFGASTSAAPPSGGLFGAASATTSAPPIGGLFGSGATTSSAPQAGGLFGSAPTGQQSGGLFGGAASQAGGGLFGSSTPASQPPPSGGLFGNTGTQSQSQPSGGLFGASSTQPAQGGGLFGGLNNQQPKPATSLFGGLSSTQQPQQSSMFSLGGQNQSQSSGGFGNTLGGGLSLGQSNNQQQQSVPGVRIDMANIRSTTRFNDLHETLQNEIINLDKAIQAQIQLKHDCDAIMPSHDSQLSQVPHDVEFCRRKLIGVENGQDADVQAISYASQLVKVDAEHAKLSFKAVDNLKLPPQYHNSGIWSTTENRSQSNGDGEAQDLVGFFSKTADDLAATLARYQAQITEIEQHLRFLVTSLTGGSIVGDMAPYQAFTIGGFDSVRGYGEGAVGLGRASLVANSEFSFPLTNNLEGSLFLDCGSDLGTACLVPGNPALRQGKPGFGFGFGYGIRVNTQFGQLRVDCAMNALQRKTVYFGINNVAS